MGTCVTHVPWCMLGSLTRGSQLISDHDVVPVGKTQLHAVSQWRKMIATAIIFLCFLKDKQDGVFFNLGYDMMKEPLKTTVCHQMKLMKLKMLTHKSMPYETIFCFLCFEVILIRRPPMSVGTMKYKLLLGTLTITFNIITLTPYMVLPLFAIRFADYAGGIRVSFI